MSRFRSSPNLAAKLDHYRLLGPVVGFGLFIAVGHVVMGILEHGPAEPLRLISDAAISFSMHIFGTIIVAMIAIGVVLLTN